MPPRYDSYGWVKLEEKEMNKMLDYNMGRFESLAYTKSHFFYNHGEHRSDIKLYSMVHEKKKVMITFENGYPYIDDKTTTTTSNCFNDWIKQLFTQNETITQSE